MRKLLEIPTINGEIRYTGMLEAVLSTVRSEYGTIYLRPKKDGSISVYVDSWKV